MKPLVSVIIAAYNVEPYIDHCLTSILNQSLTNIEVIVVDDHSTDGTLSKLAGYKDKRIKVIANSTNYGPSHCRNQAMKAAEGEYYAFVDSDDWITEDRFQILLENMDRLKADLISDNQLCVYGESEDPWGSIFGDLETNERKIDPVYYIDQSLGLKPIIRSDFIKKNHLLFDEKLKYGEDYLFFFTCLLLDADLWILKDGYYFYRTRRDSLMTNKVALFQSTVKTTEELLLDERVIHNKPLVNALKNRLCQRKRALHYFMVIEPLNKGDYIKALKTFFTDIESAKVMLTESPKIVLRGAKKLFKKIRAVTPEVYKK